MLSFILLCGSENKQRFFPLYNINWLILITDTECVYCAVRTGYLNKIQASVRV